MKKYLQFGFSILMVWSVPVLCLAQTDQPKLDIVFKALEDEVKRNMDSLVYEDGTKPIFIGYRISENTMVSSVATLGAIINTSLSKPHNWYSRVLVGSYELNDENFSGPDGHNRQGIPYTSLPEELDYHGIRRLFWLSTNEIFQAASMTYQNKLFLLKRSGLDTTELLPDYSRTPVVNSIKSSSFPMNEQVESLESLARELSSVFLEFPEIVDSKVNINSLFTNHWLTNSEGTKIFFPTSICLLSIYCKKNFGDDYDNIKSLQYMAKTVDELPPRESLIKDLREFCNKVMQDTTSIALEENYEGPLLITGKPVANLFAEGFFKGKYTLKASRKSLKANSDLSIDFNENEDDAKLVVGKEIYPSGITIVSTPFHDKYKNTPLLGSYEVDAEGVVPSEKLILVENGKFVAQLSNRTPTKLSKTSNGHVQWGIFGSGTLGPGVTQLMIPSEKSFFELKQEALALGKSLKLDYILWIRPFQVDSEQIEVVKISTADGVEQIVHSAGINRLNYEELKSFVSATKNKIAYNLYEGAQIRSYIVPEGVLLKNVTLNKRPMNHKKEEKPIVLNPLLDPSLNN